MRHISNKKGKCAHFFKERALDAKQIVNFFLPHEACYFCIYQLNNVQIAYENEYCQCVETLYEGAWCANWTGDGEYCTLKGGNSSRYCPGASKYENEELYWTSDPMICNKSIRKYIYH